MASDHGGGDSSDSGGRGYSSSLSSSPVVVYLVLILVFHLFPSISSTASEIGGISNGMKIPKVFINHMCSIAENPNFCVQVLVNANGHSEGDLDLETLEIIVLRLAMLNATNTREYIINYLVDDQKNNNATNTTTEDYLQKKNRGRLIFCEHRYRSSIRDIQSASEFLVFYDYQRVNMMASHVRTYANDCEHVFKSPPAIQSPFTQRNKNLSDLADIAAILSTSLMSS